MAVDNIELSESPRKSLPSILRPHQVDLINNIRAAVRSGCRRLVAQAPTGFGKTIVAADITRRALENGKRVIFTVPALSLVEQTVEKFRNEGINEIGVIQADYPLTNPMMPIQIASVQTLARRETPPADLVIIDEVHRLYTHYIGWMALPNWARVPFIGLSATPSTRGLGLHFDKLVIGATTRDLIDKGYLSPFKVFAPASPDLSEVRTVAGDYHGGDLGDVMNRNGLVADVVSTWLRLGERRPTLCFAADRAHARNLQQQFAEAGVNCGYVDAYTTADEREEIRRQFHAGELEVVANVGCLTTGLDWNVHSIILARPTKSEMLFVQMIGRGLRTAPGKSDCLILDHSDNHDRLGFVTDIHHDTLDDGETRPKAARKRETLPKKCPQCSFLKPTKVFTCPVCSFTPKPTCDVITEDGELVEFGSRLRVIEVSEAERRIFFAELRYVAADRNYKQGWAAMQFKAKFGSFPPWSWNDDETATPTATTLRWVKSRQIAYAKARAAS
jgi:DNA repair protein RadD